MLNVEKADVIFKPIPGWDNYSVSANGLIRNNKTGKVFTGWVGDWGYLCTELGNPGRGYKVHRLVAMAWIPNPDNLPEINHKNGIKTDNNIENLEWCTGAGNLKHAALNGLRPHKLSDIQCRQIRQLRKSGIKLKDLASQFAVRESTISRICTKTRRPYVD